MPELSLDEADKCVHCGKVLRNPPNCCYTAINDYEEFFPLPTEDEIEEDENRRRDTGMV